MTNQQIYVKNEAKIGSFEGKVGSPSEKLFGNSVKQRSILKNLSRA